MAKAATHVLGVDMGTRYLKIVELRRQGSSIALGALPVIVPTPDGSVDGGQVVEGKAVAEALREAVKAGGFGTKKVLMAVAGDPMVIVRVAEMAKLKGKDLEDAVKFEIGRHSQFPIEELYYDYAILEPDDAPPDSENMEVLLAAAHEEAVNSSVRAVMDARLQPVGVDVLPLAIARASMLSMGATAFSQTLCCVHLGAAATFIVIVRKGLPNFVRFLPTAGDALTDAVRSAGIADGALAEGVKRLYADASLLMGYEESFGEGEEGSVFEVSDTSASDVAPAEGEEATLLDVEAPEEALAGPGPEEQRAARAEGAAAEGSGPERSPEEEEVMERLAEALEQPIVDLATEVRRSIEFYRRQHRNEPVDAVVLSGGGALLGGLEPFMAGELGIPSFLCNPFREMAGVQENPNLSKYLEQAGPALAAAVGLAVRDMVEVPVAAGS
ncbi:MAG: type IV pilus assembly protein PilM [Armatimonadetes bacterium]|nr:type IV pilus assembly protein PilM [Armatimonadota bacterium]